MRHPVCKACGTQFSPSILARSHGRCPVCEDERQYVPEEGQVFTTLPAVRDGHRIAIDPIEPGLFALRLERRDGAGAPLGIGQRAFLVRTPAGNVLFDCLPSLDDETITALEELGGIAAIAISHPHFYGAMVEWSAAFGGAPIYLHERDRAWLPRASSTVRYWHGETLELLADPRAGGVTLIHTGGHFAGHQCLHWQAGAEGRGVLLSADQPYVGRDRRSVSFMYSFPNLIPLDARTVETIAARLGRFGFDRLYGAFPGQELRDDASAVVARSARRYVGRVLRQNATEESPSGTGASRAADGRTRSHQDASKPLVCGLDDPAG
jgi:hypothetical protein